MKKFKQKKDISLGAHEIHRHNQESTQGEHADQHTSETIQNVLLDLRQA
jgi:hypothetical protein